MRRLTQQQHLRDVEGSITARLLTRAVHLKLRHWLEPVHGCFNLKIRNIEGGGNGAGRGLSRLEGRVSHFKT